MPFDYSKLRGRIIEKYGTQIAFAKAMELSERSISLKLTGKRTWTQNEIDKAIILLGLTELDIPYYFFASEVQDIELNGKAG